MQTLTIYLAPSKNSLKLAEDLRDNIGTINEFGIKLNLIKVLKTDEKLINKLKNKGIRTVPALEHGKKKLIGPNNILNYIQDLLNKKTSPSLAKPKSKPHSDVSSYYASIGALDKDTGDEDDMTEGTDDLQQRSIQMMKARTEPTKTSTKPSALSKMVEDVDDNVVNDEEQDHDELLERWKQDNIN